MRSVFNLHSICAVCSWIYLIIARKQLWLQAALLPIILLSVSAAAQQQLPAQYRAFYTVRMPGPDARMQWQLQHAGNGRLLLNRKLHWLLLEVQEQSELEFRDGVLRPLLYTYRAPGRRYQLRFDWAAGQLHVQERRRRKTLPLRPGVLDPLSYGLRQRLDLKTHGAAWPGGTYRLISRRKISMVQVRNAGLESIDTPGGSFLALRTEQLRQEPKEREQRIIWYAQALDYLPVRVQWREKGRTFTASLLAAD